MRAYSKDLRMRVLAAVDRVEAMGRALDAVTARDVRGWFAHCGYPLGAQPS